jgi:predicted ribosomally synthesized peptide with SipW-like signal peptide
MRRSIIVSLLVVGAVAAMVSGASFSVFSDTESASGTVTAGTVALDDGGVETFLIDFPSPSCPGPMGVGDICNNGVPGVSGGYVLTYTGTLDAHVALSLSTVESSHPGAACFTVVGTADLDGAGLYTLPIPPGYTDPAGFPVVGGGAAETIRVWVTAALTRDSNDCQGVSATATVTAVATED